MKLGQTNRPISLALITPRNMSTIPLIVDGRDVLSPVQGTVVNEYAQEPVLYQSATKELALQAAQSSAQAFASWSKTTPIERRTLLFKLAQVCDPEPRGISGRPSLIKATRFCAIEPRKSSACVMKRSIVAPDGQRLSPTTPSV